MDKEALIAFLQLNGFKYDKPRLRYTRFELGPQAVPYNMVVYFESVRLHDIIVPKGCAHVRHDTSVPGSSWTHNEDVPLDELQEFVANFIMKSKSYNHDE